MTYLGIWFNLTAYSGMHGVGMEYTFFGLLTGIRRYYSRRTSYNNIMSVNSTAGFDPHLFAALLRRLRTIICSHHVQAHEVG